MKLVLNFVKITGLKKIGHDVKNKVLKNSKKNLITKYVVLNYNHIFVGATCQFRI